MHVRKTVGLVEARASLGGLARTVGNGGGAIAITRRSRLAAVLVNGEQYEADMAELDHYRRRNQGTSVLPFSRLMEITGDLVEGNA